MKTMQQGVALYSDTVISVCKSTWKIHENWLMLPNVTKVNVTKANVTTPPPPPHDSPSLSFSCFLFLSLSSFFRRLQVSRGGASAADMGGAGRSEPPQRQQLLLHDPVVQQPHPQADERESGAREGDGGGQGEVQERPGCHPCAMWVPIPRAHYLKRHLLSTLCKGTHSANGRTLAEHELSTLSAVLMESIMQWHFRHDWSSAQGYGKRIAHKHSQWKCKY